MADGNITVEVSTQAAQAELERLREAAKRVIAAQSGSAFAVNESINELRRALEGE